ncbi:RluA family pseudouridine synthase [Dysgonomonas sp. 520]|uniref:RluA family pseudouridine synthase n=1 Tax=Dysgonomonas sp. 520 TaxID=2302931 RepID=UPI0013D166F6|nr:RluA family pseudouridine synthase [Dysgonomonas sp. 520]NDW08378.1 RluA family pseudouridine synthase [Dysgonomonas sp. 520]
MKKEEKDIILQTLKVEEKAQLLPFLIDQKVRKSRNAIKSLLSHKQVKVNGKVETLFNFEISAGDVVTIHKASHAYDTKQLDGVQVIFEDEYLLVVSKDARLLSIATDKEKLETAYGVVSRYLRTANPDARPYVLHRLDRDVSGLMIYAKTPFIQEKIQKNWNDIILAQKYVAVVEGRPSPTEGTIETWLTEDKNYVMHSSDRDNGGQKAITHYNTLKSVRRFAMLEIVTETARKNQIRVHMKHIGHSIVGDKKYGASINPIKRMALHAHELVIKHPATNETIVLKSPIPQLMQKLVEPVVQ